MAFLRLLNRLLHGPFWVKFLGPGVAASGLALFLLNLLFLFQTNFRLLSFIAP
jgi:hypothetical protein